VLTSSIALTEITAADDLVTHSYLKNDHDHDLTNKVTHGQYEKSRRYIFTP